MTKIIDKQNNEPLTRALRCGRTLNIDTFELPIPIGIINVGTGRQFTVSKAHQPKARKRYGKL